MRRAFWLLAIPFTASAAAPTYYTDRATFEGLTTPGFIVEDYSDPAYIFIQSDAIMSGVLGETDYMTTGFANLNIVQNSDSYCAGCNGSYELSFLTTSFSLPGNGITNVGLDVTSNDAGTPYHAYVEFGDGSFDNYPLPAGASFFGVIEYQQTIVSIHMGLANGGVTTSGSFVIDNLTVGNGCSGLGPDLDADGIEDTCDNCVYDANADQADADGDGSGDICDICPNDPQDDGDEDGVCGDVDPCPWDNPDDSDLDGVCDRDDMCEGEDDTLDADADGFPDACDNCPNDPQPNQRDEDLDGYGMLCECDDVDAAVNPDAEEICDGIDNDCDGSIDLDAIDAITWWADFDADGEGNPEDAITDCSAPNSRVENTLDCDDDDAAINTLATEICDSVDNNCDGEIDENLADCVSEADKAASLGCSCDSSSSPLGAGWLILLGALGIRRRQSRTHRPE